MSTKFKKGFTLVELIITVSISVMVMASVLFNYSKFNTDLALSSAAQEISIAIRQTQVYSLSVKERTAGSGSFSNGYGIYFSPASPQTYIIFSDTNSDGRYNAGTDTVIETGILRNSIKIFAVCGVPFGGVLACPPAAGMTSADITFIRPKTDANIRFDNGGAGLTGTYQSGMIVLSSPQGKYSTTTIENTGQIYVN
jgi:prepilin-type N-terminal cleavage/methylation domain-containing protein